MFCTYSPLISRAASIARRERTFISLVPIMAKNTYVLRAVAIVPEGEVRFLMQFIPFMRCVDSDRAISKFKKRYICIYIFIRNVATRRARAPVGLPAYFLQSRSYVKTTV